MGRVLNEFLFLLWWLQGHAHLGELIN